MKQNDEHQDEGQKSIFWDIFIVTRQSYGSFAFKLALYPDFTCIGLGMRLLAYVDQRC